VRHAGGHFVDHIFARGLAPGRHEVPDRGPLSDHAPVLARLG
jgi:endonuclease/exonuclease/phosphatase (EEP) superfamily protein YafD